MPRAAWKAAKRRKRLQWLGVHSSGSDEFECFEECDLARRSDCTEIIELGGFVLARHVQLLKLKPGESILGDAVEY